MMDEVCFQLAWLRPHRRRLFRSFLVSFCLGFLLFCGAPTTVDAKVQLQIDKTFGQVSGWIIGFSEGIGGCLAAAKYRDETTVWLGFSGGRDNAYIAFTSPKWRSI